MSYIIEIGSSTNHHPRFLSILNILPLIQNNHHPLLLVVLLLLPRSLSPSAPFRRPPDRDHRKRKLQYSPQLPRLRRIPRHPHQRNNLRLSRPPKRRAPHKNPRLRLPPPQHSQRRAQRQRIRSRFVGTQTKRGFPR